MALTETISPNHRSFCVFFISLKWLDRRLQTLYTGKLRPCQALALELQTIFKWAWSWSRDPL